jgi:hypothetical protein
MIIGQLRPVSFTQEGWKNLLKKASPNGRIVGNDSSLARECLCSAPFRLFLFKINENLATNYSGRFTLIWPLLTYAAEQSASWQHWWEGE